jgi:hypothetical protein
MQIINSVFSGNMASVDGGAVTLAQGVGVLTNCTFNRNIAKAKKTGQALAVQGAIASLTNCILWDNVDATQGQIALTGVAGFSTQLAVSYSDVLGGESAIIRKGIVAITWGKKNIDADPQFRDPVGVDRVAGTVDDDLHVRGGSPCVDAGDDTAVPADADDLNSNGNRVERVPFDLDGQPRFVDRPDAPNTGVADAPAYPAIVDLGAYEVSATATP